MIGRTIDFIHNLTWADVPPDVQHRAARCVLDLSGTLVAGQATELSRLVRDVTAAVYGGDEATLLLDGRRVSAPGAALANGMTIDAMDMHDGYRPAKGHAGVNVFPAALAMGEAIGWRGEDFGTALVVGYEVALRAGVALHHTASDYHTSGAWGALGAAAVTARALGLDAAQTRHALGIAEYHGPRSPMMRCIDHPTMLKDGSGWGSMSGVLAGRLAAAGFTGAPALTVEGDNVVSEWANLGQTWLTRDLYFKPYACCRWAQPAVEGACALVAEHRLAPTDIAEIVVHTFEAATRLTVTRPVNTEQAQHSNRSISAQVITLLQRGLQDGGAHQSEVLGSIRRRRFFNPHEMNVPNSTTLLSEDRAR
jgi:2-methylcitrate dehydratase PrpD